MMKVNTIKNKNNENIANNSTHPPVLMIELAMVRWCLGNHTEVNLVMLQKIKGCAQPGDIFYIELNLVAKN